MPNTSIMIKLERNRPEWLVLYDQKEPPAKQRQFVFTILKANVSAKRIRLNDHIMEKMQQLHKNHIARYPFLENHVKQIVLGPQV